MRIHFINLITPQTGISTIITTGEISKREERISIIKITQTPMAINNITLRKGKIMKRDRWILTSSSLTEVVSCLIREMII
jgi:hypothetical protein